MEKTLVSLIEEAGIVGAGGAGFPTHVKVKGKADYVIINGAECEPLLRVDQQLMALEVEAILETLNLLVSELSAKEGIIALKEKYHEAIEVLNRHLVGFPRLKLKIMENYYPAGDEQVVVYEATGRIVPEGGIPIQVGVVVLNVETVLNIYNAYKKGEPVTEKYVTITGEVANRVTVKVPIGITVQEAITLAGGPRIQDYLVINGGPMMGSVINPHSPITKTVKGLIVLPSEHPLIKSFNKNMYFMLREAKTACMHCNLCTEVCPRYLLGHRLEPHKLIRTASYGSVCDGGSSAVNAYLCCNCRLCEYACVQDLQPWKLNSFLKAKLLKEGIKNNLNNTPEKVEVFREYKKYPVSRLIYKLGIKSYDTPAPLTPINKDFKEVILSLRQHVGAASKPIVKVGDKVEKGRIIAVIPEGKLGSNIHSSIDGTVIEVTDYLIKVKKT